MSQSSKNRKPIGVVKAAFAEPFRIAMLNNGVDPERYFRRNRLPLPRSRSNRASRISACRPRR
jgi:hypothetical protein